MTLHPLATLLISHDGVNPNIHFSIKRHFHNYERCIPFEQRPYFMLTTNIYSFSNRLYLPWYELCISFCVASISHDDSKFLCKLIYYFNNTLCYGISIRNFDYIREPMFCKHVNSPTNNYWRSFTCSGSVMPRRAFAYYWFFLYVMLLLKLFKLNVSKRFNIWLCDLSFALWRHCYHPMFPLLRDIDDETSVRFVCSKL